jgi:hypothetical protein
VSGWTDDERRRVGDATELELASRRRDSTLRQFTTMWVAGVGEDIYVRSAGGPDRPWYQHAIASGAGSIRADGVEADVYFVDAADSAPHDAVDVAYHAKYDRYGPAPVGAVTGPSARPVTIRLVRSES